MLCGGVARVDFDSAVDDDVEGLVAREVECVACDEAAGLEVSGELVEDLGKRSVSNALLRELRSDLQASRGSRRP